MEKKDLLWIATKAVDKGWDYETLKYGDDLYGQEQYADDVWDYVVELKEIGTKAFYDKYKDFKLY